jgi:hypothetical protein
MTFTSKLSIKDKQRFTYLKKKLALPFILFSLASYAVVEMMPLFLTHATHPEQPPLWQMSIVGVIIIVFSALFLAYAAKIIGLARGWLVLGVLFSSLIVIVKFILVPQSLYSQTFDLGNLFSYFDPNNPDSYTFIALSLFASYILILWFAYRHYHGKVTTALDKNSPAIQSSSFGKVTAIIALVIIALIVLLVASGGAALLVFPLIIGGSPTLGYLNYAVSGGGIPLIVATVLAILLSVKYLQHSSNVAIQAKDGTILAITFWICFSLLLVYHILWVIYMTVMLTIWPFKTISPSGK